MDMVFLEDSVAVKSSAATASMPGASSCHTTAYIYTWMLMIEAVKQCSADATRVSYRRQIILRSVFFLLVSCGPKDSPAMYAIS